MLACWKLRTIAKHERETLRAMRMSTNGRSVSIVIATYNAGALIENCLLSVIHQTHPEIEVIVVDGGSTDGTINILEKYSKQVKWTSERDRGLNDAQFKGVTRAKNDWVFFLGADDILAGPKAIENLFNACSDISAIDILTGHALYEDGRLRRSDKPGMLRVKNTIHGQGALYRRSLFKQKSYDMALKVYYDYDFNLWALTTGKRFFHTNVLLTVMGCGGHSDRPKWRNYLEDMKTRGRYVKGPALLATNVFAVARFIYKVVWFRALRTL